MVEGRDTRGPEKEKGTSFLTNRIGIGFEEGHALPAWKGGQGCRGRRVPEAPTGAKPHFRRAIHTR